MMEKTNIILKWNGKEFHLESSEEDSISDLKREIQKQTGVRPDRQKLLNLKYKGKIPEDEYKICQLKLKYPFKLMMMGSLEEDIEKAITVPDDPTEVVNDLDIDEEEVAIENQEVYLAKVERRIKEYNIDILNEFRPNKKLLVLDIDYTLFDNRSAAQTGAELMRPYLHEFLTGAYEYYDIVIWSATGMKWIEEKMKLLGVVSNSSYKIACYLDYHAMISVHLPKYGVIEVKPLGVLWGKFPQFSPKNTIMFDDVRKNFIMNPKNGLKIKAFRQAHINRHVDQELLFLTQYLRDLANNCDDFTSVNHKHWAKYKPKKK